MLYSLEANMTKATTATTVAPRQRSAYQRVVGTAQPEALRALVATLGKHPVAARAATAYMRLALRTVRTRHVIRHAAEIWRIPATVGRIPDRTRILG